MIISHSADNKHILFTPEDIKERKILDKMPAFFRHGLYFYCVNKQNVVYNLYQRAKRKIKHIRMTPEVNEMINGEFRLRELPENFQFHTSPLKHQLIALRFAYTFGSFLNLCEPGLGKTKVTLDYIWLMQFKKSVIICPKPLRFVWVDEVAKHRPELKIYVVQTTDWDLEKKAVTEADVVVINYNKAVSLEEHIDALKADFIAVDEALIKDPSTDRTQCISRLGAKVPNRCAMSGTLVNNSPLDIFAPVRFTEPSLTGSAFGKFRDEYAVTKKITVNDKKGIITIGFRKVQEVKDMVASCAIIMTKAEWLKDVLPPKEFKQIYVQMGDKQREYYHMLAQNYILPLPEVGAEVEVDNPLTVLAKLTQISNGFIYYKENIEESINDLYGDETRKKTKANRKTYVFEEQPKARALLDLIESSEFNTYPAATSGTVASDSGGNAESSETSSGKSADHASNGESSVAVRERGREGSDGHSERGECSQYSAGDRSETARLYSSLGENSEYLARGSESLYRRNDSASTADTVRIVEPNDRSTGKYPSTSFEVSDDGLSGTRIHTDDFIGASSYGLFDSNELRSSDCDGRGATTCSTNIQSENHRHKSDNNGSTVYSGTRAIIWFNFSAELDIISKALSENSHTFITIKGGDSDIGGRIKKFNTDPSIRFCVCQAKTINYGVTILGTEEGELSDDVYATFDPVISDEIFYSLNFSLEVFLQQQDRIHRIGQKRKCRYWILLTNSPIERKIADRLEDKLICNREILVDIMSTLDLNILMS